MKPDDLVRPVSIQIRALYRQSGSDRLEKQPTDLRRHHHYMRDGALDGFAQREAFGRRRGNQSLESVGDVRTQFAMRVIWCILGAACAALAGVLFTILLK